MALHEIGDGQSKLRTTDLFTEIYIVGSDSNSRKRLQQFTAMKQRQLISYTICSKNFLIAQEKRRLWKYLAEFAQKSPWGRTDNRRITELQLLSSGIEPNPGPMEQTTKLARFQKWTRELSTWLIPYCTRMEKSLEYRVHLLLPFLGPTAAGTSCIFPVVCETMG